MTPEQKIKWAILVLIAEAEERQAPEVNIENIDELYDEAVLNDEHWDALYEFREGQVTTDIPSESSRHFESKSVAAKMPDDTWVGWTYWYGGGKHAEPDAIDWVDQAYDLNVTEEEKTVTIQTFTKESENDV